MGRSFTPSWQCLWAQRLPNRLAPLPFFRPMWKPSVCSGSSPGRPRRGFAVKELLLVLVVTGSALLGLKVMDPLSKAQYSAALPTLRKLMFQREVPLGDEFLCLVSVDKYAKPDSSGLPLYLSRVRFASRSPRPRDAFMIDIIAGQAGYWHQIATCRVWTLMSPEAALDYVHEHGEIAIAPSVLTKEERMAAVSDALSREVQAVTSLDEPLWRCVPAPLQETGIVVKTDEMGLKYVDQFQGFPLGRLASAIRTAARDDDWTSADPAALLPANNIGDPALTADEEQAIAQAFVYRLLPFLAAQ